MTAEEVRKKYCIPVSVLQHYKTMEFYQKTHPFPRPYDPEDVKYLNKILSLKDAGFSHSEIDQYMCLSLDSASQENKLNFLHQKRSAILSKIHVLEQQIDRLDYLRCQIQKDSLSSSPK